MNPETKKEIDARVAHYEEVLRRSVLAAWLEAMKEMGATASARDSAAGARMEMVALSTAACATMANLIVGLGMTMCSADPTGSRKLAQALVAQIASVVKDIHEAQRSGRPPDEMHVHTFRNGKEVPFDFRDHMSGGRA